MARMSHRYPQELRERAARLVADSRDQYESEWSVNRLDRDQAGNRVGRDPAQVGSARLRSTLASGPA